ncbi:MurR/RpiR family transcriptional regulator [Mesorhizobium sp. YM1C-6-2]|uniref:MurR/RpiR family transcriptional regulator n=1 Tax=Mesorhizobium sp. YM1C-6-2 TaxID=1827501 RepID=UPI000EF198C8|nr:MurR/RpiR family transcriptional regulator [Mesorhizobium sp. YM1C-6-2]RLP27123.1 MurR/RpiR family transcriptional regulator [Mesorhizobium sp. YM1C-6-2]
MSEETGSTHDYGEFVATLLERKPSLSRRLQQVAQYLLNNPEDAAIFSIVEIARRAGVPPSAITRFAKELGFDGFAGLQALFKQRLLGPRMSYADRLQAVNREVAAGSREPGDPRDPHEVAETFIQAAFDALLRLREDVAGAALTPFVDALQKARAVHIAAARGAFGVGSYTYYGLSRIGKRAFLLDNLGAMRAEQLAAMDADDALLVITFDDYTPETVELARKAAEAGRTVLAITDNELSPVAPLASHVLYVKEGRLGHFRSQVPAMVLCQTLVMSLGYRTPEVAAREPTRRR